MDIRQIVLHLQANDTISAVQRATGLNWRTVQRYRAWAEQQGLLSGPLPPLETIQQLVAATLTSPTPPQTVSSLEPYRDRILRLHADGVEGTAILQRLCDDGYTGTISSLYRFLRRLHPVLPDTPVRIERAPGEEAQVDFGYVGKLVDPATGKLRKAWAFVMVLAWSRHMTVELVFDQSLPTWIRLHRNAFNTLGGVPRRVVLDNLKAGITRACFDDPQVQATYRECAEHYGFLVAPCAPRTPQHKGKVESGVHYVQRNFMAGRPPMRIDEANAAVADWCLTTAGRRIHGTTREQPLVRFTATEQATLKPLPETPYDFSVWKRATLHRDGYVVFENAYYSAPFRLCGETLWVRGSSREVRIYRADHALVATHTRAERAGERLTHPDHLVPEKVPGALWTRDICRAAAAEVGPSTDTLVQTLLDDRTIDRHTRVVRILQLRSTVGDARLEAACQRGLHYGELTYRGLKHLLERGLDAQPPADAVSTVVPRTFARSTAELVGHLGGGVPWK